MPKTRVWLDDDLEFRPTPDGFTRAATAAAAIALLETGDVVELSLDHDLGPPEAGTGYDVCLWLAGQSVDGRPELWPEKIDIHSANPVGQANMAGVIRRYSGLSERPGLRWER